MRSFVPKFRRHLILFSWKTSGCKLLEASVHFCEWSSDIVLYGHLCLKSVTKALKQLNPRPTNLKEKWVPIWARSKHWNLCSQLFKFRPCLLVTFVHLCRLCLSYWCIFCTAALLFWSFSPLKTNGQWPVDSGGLNWNGSRSGPGAIDASFNEREKYTRKLNVSCETCVQLPTTYSSRALVHR